MKPKPPRPGDDATFLKRWGPPALGALLFAAALWVLHRELREVHYHQVRRTLAALPHGRIVLALLCAAANYLVLTGCDQLGFRYIGRKFARWRITLASFVGYAVSNNVGFSLLSGAPARYRFYARWGLDAGSFARLVVFYSGTFWVGLVALGGWSLTFHSHRELGGEAGRAVGILLLGVTAGYFVLCIFRRKPLRLRGFEMPVPSPRMALGQLILSMADWALAAATLYALLPPGGPPYALVLGAFLGAQLLGLVSHVPGGLGVFEGVMVLLLGSHLPRPELLSALVLFRIVYYLIPLALALLILVADEIRLRRGQFTRAGTALGTLSIRVAPSVLAVVVFLAGVLLLLSGATPSEPARLRWLAETLSPAIFETSHFLGSVVGVGLIIIARGVARRLDAAYYLAIAGLVAGIAASLLKGLDWEEALALTMLLLAFIPCRPAFDRKTAFWDVRFSPSWTLAMVSALGASIWLGMFSFKHVEYAHELWWQFSLGHDASRSLRASVGAALAVLTFGVMRLLHPAEPSDAAPSPQDLEDAGAVLAAQDATLPFLVYLADKSIIFTPARDAFLMYGIQGRTWAALGDPVGAGTELAELPSAFVERAADQDGRAVFYQVTPEHLHLYADLGMTFLKLGEEARVSLDTFSLEGRSQSGLRGIRNRLVTEGMTFRVASREEVPDLLPALKEISDDWLSRKSASEKGFSLGRFDEGYLSRFPMALMEREGRIEAFANVLPGPTRRELSVDLMRYRHTAPKGIMDGLFIDLFFWGRKEGYLWFNLGMAPLSGVEATAVSPVRLRLSHWIYQHGEAFYNFRGLRAFKEKFHPVWEPRYLAYPAGLALPRILADIAALVAGGYVRIFR